MQEKTLNIVFITCCSDRVKLETVKSARQKLFKVIIESGHKIIEADTLLSNWGNHNTICAEISKVGFDCIVVHYGGWTQDKILASFLMKFNKPFIIWGTEDIVNSEGIPETVAMVGFLEACGALKKLKLDFLYGFGDVENKYKRKAIMDFLDIFSLVKKLNGLKIGMLGIGRGCEGFLDTTFNDIYIKRYLGIDIIDIPLSDLLSSIENIEDSATDPYLKELKLHTEENIDPAIMKESIKEYIALKQIYENSFLDGLTIRCWPEFKKNNICTPCYAISMLNYDSLVAACEGDIPGNIAMIILKELSSKTPFMFDIVEVNETKNTASIFHCGAMPPVLAQDNFYKYKTHLKPHIHKAGVTCEFKISKGKITFLRLDEVDGSYRLFAGRAEVLDCDKYFRGNYGRLKFDEPIGKTIENIIENGFGHHLVAVHDDVLEKLRLFSKFLNLEFIKN